MPKESALPTKNKLSVIALTGGIGSGKSTVAEIFRGLGATVIDADVLAREVVEPGTAGLQAVIKEFGPDYLTKQSTLDRAGLANLIFSDPLARKTLENILHPLIRERFLEHLEKSRDSSRTPIIYEVPLFFESENSYPEVKKVLVVWASESACAQRLMARNNLTIEQALQRIRSQLSLDEKAKRADWTIKNDSDIASLAHAVQTTWDLITNL